MQGGCVLLNSTRSHLAVLLKHYCTDFSIPSLKMQNTSEPKVSEH
jgi:hypothetical protein